MGIINIDEADSRVFPFGDSQENTPTSHTYSALFLKSQWLEDYHLNRAQRFE